MRVRNIVPNAIPHGLKVDVKYKTLVDLTLRTIYGKVHIIRKDFVDHPAALPLRSGPGRIDLVGIFFCFFSFDSFYFFWWLVPQVTLNGYAKAI